MGADKGYDGKDFIRTARELNVIPDVAGTTRPVAATGTAEPRGSRTTPSAWAAAG